MQFVDSQTVEVEGKRLHGSNVLVATGSRPVVPDIEGLDSVSYLTSDLLTVDESVELRELPASLLIIGGGYIALEFGQMFSRFGTAVSLVPRAGAIRDTRGIIKMTADADSNEVLGVSMVGHNAGEVIHEAAMAMRYRATIPDFIDLLHVFPAMAEALKIVAISRFKDPAKLSSCAE